MPGPIYLDYAAATPVDPAVLRAMQPYWREQFYNPSAPYQAAHQVAADIHTARSRIAHQLGAKPSEVIFTAGGTEANNLAIHGIMQNYKGANLIVSSLEHEAALEPAKQYRYQLAPALPDGRVDVAGLVSQINDTTVLVSVMYANNEIGTIQPIREISRQLRTIRQQRRRAGNQLPLYFHTDASQAAAYLDMHVHRLGVDLLTLNGGKMYGPKQSGALFVASTVRLKPQILGGGQERGLRSGTENVAGSIGLSIAFELAQQRRITEVKRLHQLQRGFIKQLERDVPQAVINGSLQHRLPNNLHLTITGIDNERVMLQLDEQGIRCATGSACSAANGQASTVLAALGLSDAQAQASLRFSLGRGTTATDIRRTVQALAAVL